MNTALTVQQRKYHRLKDAVLKEGFRYHLLYNVHHPETLPALYGVVFVSYDQLMEVNGHSPHPDTSDSVVWVVHTSEEALTAPRRCFKSHIPASICMLSTSVGTLSSDYAVDEIRSALPVVPGHHCQSISDWLKRSIPTTTFTRNL